MISQPAWTASELDWIRILLAMMLLLDFLWVVPSELKNPRGLSRWVDLRPLVHSKHLNVMSRMALVLFAVGKFDPWVSLFLALYVFVRLTVHVSVGAVGHGWHLPLVVLIGFAAGQMHGFVVELLGDPVAQEVRDARSVWWAIQAVVAMYFTSGVAKVAYTCGTWLRRSPNLVLPMVSKRELRLAKGGPSGRGGWGDTGERSRIEQASTRMADRLVDLTIRRPSMARMIFGAGLAVELLSPVALLHPIALVLVGAALLLLHVANGVVLDLHFKLNQRVLIILFLNIPGLLLAG